MSAGTEKDRTDIVKLSGQGASAVMGRIDIVTAGSTPGGDDDEGTLSITENGTYNVQDYAEAEVNVPVGVFPTGTKNITENGTYDVTEFANAKVNVPASAVVSGTKTIEWNGTHDVTRWAKVIVNVHAPRLSTITIKNSVSRSIIIASLTYGYTKVKPAGSDYTSQFYSLIRGRGSSVQSGESIQLNGWYLAETDVGSLQGILYLSGFDETSMTFRPSVDSVTVTPVGAGYYFVNSGTNQIDSTTIEIIPRETT